MLNKIFPSAHPFPLVTALLVLVNVAIYLAQMAAGLPWTATPEQQISWGGNLAALTLTGDYWRLFTNTFLHSGAVHLLLNLSLLVTAGPRAERQFGRVAMLVVYLTGGMLASLMSAWWLGRGPHLVVSVGASGAIMALCGALLAAQAGTWWQGVKSIHEPGSEAALAQVVGINVVMGLFITGVDQAAHVGGLLAGAAAAVLVGVPAAGHRAAWRAGRLACSAVVLLGVVWALLQAADSEKQRDVRSQLEEQQQIADRDAADKAAEASQAASLAKISAARKLAAEQLEKQLPGPVAEDVARGRTVKFGRSGMAFALSGDESKAYTLDHDANQFVVVDVKSGTVEKRIAGPQEGLGQTIAACESSTCDAFIPMNIMALRSQPLVLVTGMHRDAVTLIDTEAGRIVRTVKVGRVPYAMVLSPDQHRAYVHNTGSNSLSVIDIPTATLIGTLVLWTDQKWFPYAHLDMWFSADGSRLYAGNTPRHQIEVVDTQALKVLEKVIPDYAAEEYATPQATPGADVLARSQVGIVFLSPAGDKFSRQADFCDDARVSGVVVGPRTASAQLMAVRGYDYDYNQGNDPQPVIRIADLESRVTLGRYPLSHMAVQMQFSADGKRLFAMSSDGVLSIIDPLQRVADKPLLCDKPRQ